jgi:hypothetical protein
VGSPSAYVARWAGVLTRATLVSAWLTLFHLMICHSKSAIDPAPQDFIKTTRLNNIQDAIGMHEMYTLLTYASSLDIT